MFLEKADNDEKNKGHSYGNLLMAEADKKIIHLFFQIGVHSFKRYWRTLWLTCILIGIFLVSFSMYTTSRNPENIIDDHPNANERSIDQKHRAGKESILHPPKHDERDDVLHPKSSKMMKKSKSAIVPPILEPINNGEHIKINKPIELNSVKNKNDKLKNVHIRIKSNIETPNNGKVLTEAKNKQSPSLNKGTELRKKLFELNKLVNDKDKIKAEIDNNRPVESIINENEMLKLKLIQNTDFKKNILKRKIDIIRHQTQRFPNYYEDGLHPTWTFKVSRSYDEEFLHHWSDPIRKVSSSAISDQPVEGSERRGENGTAFVPSKNDIDYMMKLQKENNYNVFASERISLHRTLPDVRSTECKILNYPEKLPSTSVIIVVHNEIWSTLFRTVWSVIERSPPELLKEIILVDDASTWIFLKRNLDSYVLTLPVHVRIIRTKKREGLIRARLLGAKVAKGSILTFFDAHMEVTDGWLQPIVSRIANDRSVVAVPRIDFISSDDMAYETASTLEITGLRWHLVFSWLKVPQRELLRTKFDKTAPIRMPTHVGCAFSVDREFFFEIGSFDEGMNIWGSENVEMAFRVWMCGGSLEVIPCSHVGHLYRISTYSFNGDAEQIKIRNNNRLVEVWLDEFKDIFYAANPVSRSVSPGNVTDRLELRKRLQCKNFRWYLENIYPESTWLKEYEMMGEMQYVETKTCLDIATTTLRDQLKLYPCHGFGGNQFFAFARSGQIVTIEEICVGIKITKVVLVPCTEEDEMQLWDWNSKNQWIVHRQTNQCMQNNGNDVIIGTCDSNNGQFKWNFKSNLQRSNPLRKLLLAHIELNRQIGGLKKQIGGLNRDISDQKE